MEDLSKCRRTRLPDYLIEHCAGINPEVQAVIMADIYNGRLQARLPVSPKSLPAGTSMATMLRHAMSAAGEPSEVSALSDPTVKAEIGKAARGRDADWNLLDRMIVLAPTTAATAPRKTKAVPREMANKENILTAIKALGHDPLNLPAPDGKAGTKKQVQDHIGKAISASAFKKAWQALRDDGSIGSF